jgi:hypothetical protein
MRIRFGPALAGTVVAAAAALAVANRRWSEATSQAVARLTRASGAGVDGRYSPEEIADLPAPVARYFEFALTPGQPLVRRAQVEQRGDFAMKPGEWRRMRASQTFWASPPGFVWDATISMAPGVNIRVRDGYFGGSAKMKGSIAGLIPIVDQADTPGLAEGSLLRYLAEAPLLPTALLPGAGVQWTAIDDTTARATLSDAGVTVSMNAHFGAAGEITRISALRFRDVNGIGVPTPFEAVWSDYLRVDGMMIPTAGEAMWLLREGPHSFWRARITGAVFH